MQLPRLATKAEAIAAAALVASLFIRPALALHCNKIVVHGKPYNLEPLGGPHSVVTWKDTPPSITNTSYTVDICRPLKRKDSVKEEEKCPDGTRVCAIRRMHKHDEDTVYEVLPISMAPFGKPLETKVEALKDSGSNTDSEREGIRLFLKGGSYQGKKQQAIIEFECDKDKEGTEGEWAPEDEYKPGDGRKDDDDEDDNKERRRRRKREDEGDGDDEKPPGKETQLIKEGAALKFMSYGYEDKFKGDVLRLEWRTKHVCANSEGDDSSDESSHWGFFTWLFIIVFLGVSAYLIFGSWLNYTRFGARGWDLVPHGDTIRDIPYLMKDWTRSVLNTVQGSGTRGGYSAV